MKNIINKIAISAAGLIMLLGCEDFLAEDPRALISPLNFYNSDAEVRAAVNGIYGTYFWNESLYRVVGLSRFYQFGSDEINPNRLGGEGQIYSSYEFSEGNNPTRETWADLFRIVQDCNIVLDRIEGNGNISQAMHNQATGEIYFLRALAYYHLTNLWGNVPYYRVYLPIEEVQELGRFDKGTIQLDMIADLEAAQQLLPASYAASDLGRATSWAAATLAAKFYMVRSDWQGMRDKSVEIINNSWHRLLDDYGAVFSPDNEFNDEIIFEFDYVKDLAGQRRTDFFTPRIRDEPRNGADRAALEAALAARNEGMTGYGLAIPTPEMVNTFPMDDLRRPWNVTTHYLGFELFFPYVSKLWNLHQVDSPRANHGDNYIVWRLADIYLMAAEAENELNGPANAYQYINRVRERAFDPDQPLAGLTQEQFRQAVRDERKWELMGEDHRRLDLIRWGILVETIQNTQFLGPYASANTNVRPHHVLWPIPLEEIALNPALLESDPTNNGYR
jgi:starch-binding outer membrane protein, SusD/RagB family